MRGSGDRPCADAATLASDRMATGIVKWFNNAKGYGFITPDDKSADVFVYFTAIQASGFQTLKPGQRVTYDLQSGPKGSQAINVRLGNGKDHRPDSH